MDYLALKIPADIKQKMTAHTVVDQPEPEDGGCYPFGGENGAYKLCNTDMLQIVPAAYTDVEDQLTPDWREWCNIVGDALFVVPGTDENIKMMESILDS
jgi:hypothetical protein